MRELEHLVERALLAEGEVLTINVPLDGGEAANQVQPPSEPTAAQPKLGTLEEIERQHTKGAFGYVFPSRAGQREAQCRFFGVGSFPELHYL